MTDVGVWFRYTFHLRAFKESRAIWSATTFGIYLLEIIGDKKNVKFPKIYKWYILHVVEIACNISADQQHLSVL